MVTNQILNFSSKALVLIYFLMCVKDFLLPSWLWVIPLKVYHQEGQRFYSSSDECLEIHIEYTKLQLRNRSPGKFELILKKKTERKWFL